MAIQAMSDDMVMPVGSREVAGGLTARVYSDFLAAEPVWRDLETRALTTPYQLYDWISAYCKSGFETPETIAILALSDHSKVVALLPFGISRRFGVRMAQIIGTSISNADSLIYDPAYAKKLTPEALRQSFAALAEAGAAADIVSFHCLTPNWQNHDNPLLGFTHTPAPNNLYLGELDAVSGSIVDALLPRKRRTNIRRSERRLIESFGDLELRQACTIEDIERAHEAFNEQRAKRFRLMGVENVFATPPFQTLFKSLAIASLGKPHPVFRYHALFAGDNIVATSLGVCTSTHYSQYINSTTDGEAAKYSLMGVTMSYLVDELRNQGIMSFDMGLGDFDYKTDWTKATTVYDSLIPISPAGAIAAPLLLQARKLKRVVKQTPALWKFARSILALKSRLGSR